ncbi:protein ROLLING AND ERECT LEAF 2 [Euphorbia lathyris]|uniref:protein ROLLING AND ERECT LEAF 2 n=1 Tax=Euphorbia lathyris TaxID=212925 RepID=UPI00331385EA
MGCAQSKVDNEESVSRCKERKILMKEAVAARNAFAAAHSGFTVSLKNTGAALSDYAQGEVLESHHLQEPPPLQPISHPPPPPPPPPPSIESFPPPPPLPNFSPSPIKRTLSMPEMPLKLQRNPGEEMNSSSIAEEEDEDEDEEEHELNSRTRKGNANNNKNKTLSGSRGPQVGSEEATTQPSPPSENHAVPPMPEVKNMSWDYFFTMDEMSGPSLEPEDESDRNHSTFRNLANGGVQFGGIGGGEIEPKTPEKHVENLAPVVEDDEEAEEAVKKEKKHIEHSKTAPPDFRVVGKKVVSAQSINLTQVLSGIDDHFLKASESAQEVAKMLEATRLHYHSNFADNRGYVDHSARVMRVITWNRSFRGVPNGEGGKDELDSEDYETHATVLDKLLAWEKKLYDEVKQGELMKLEYRKKVALLNKQKKRGATAESLEKTKAAVSHLHTRYIVDMQSMDSTVSEVNDIRDKQLFPKLAELVDGMAKMWSSMCIHHDSQLKIVTDLKSLDVSHAVKETTRYHHERTKQLFTVVQEWHLQFEKLVAHQKQYIQILNSWLKLNLIPIESSLKEKVSSPPKVPNPPIQALLHSWHDHLEKLPDEVAKTAISSFAAVIKTIELHQEEEMKLKEKCEETRKEFLRKSQAFDDWYQKYMQRRTPTDETDGDRGEDANAKDPVMERQFAVESLKKRLEEEVEDHQRHCLQVREKSLGSLKIRLPELFRAMSDYAHACSDSYERLKALTQSGH